MKMQLPARRELISSPLMQPTRFQILGSNSSGNCALLETDTTRILIDAGFSAKKIKELLTEAGRTIEQIDGVFITHEHNDHTVGLRGLSRYPHLRFFANRDTAKAIQKRLRSRPNWHVFETGAKFSFRDLDVTSFSVPHDAYDPVGFVFEWGYGDLFSPRRSLGWVTDLGYIPQLVRERIRSVNILVVESNYDVELLEKDPHRPWSVKQRIRGRHGHLSNQDALDLLSSMESVNWEQVFLVHLSRDCNDIGRIRTLFAPLVHSNCAFRLNVVDPRTGLAPAIAG